MKKFLLIFCLATIAIKSFSQSKDEMAIKLLLEKESATWRSGDVKGHAECWAIKPYTRIIVSKVDGNVVEVQPEMMINPPAAMVGKGGTAVNTNYKMRISGNTAWVSHNETSTAVDGTKSYSYEFRMLEKIKGKWKLVGQSIHMYNAK
jgi:hypothetical protein